MRSLSLMLTAFVAVTFAARTAEPATGDVKPGVFTQDLEAAQQLAAAKKLPLLLDFSGSDWCYWCKLMDKQVFAKDAFKTWAKDNLVLVLIDFPRFNPDLVPEKFRARNRQLMQQYNVEGFPTFVLLDAEGKVLGRLGASPKASPESFITQIKQLLKD